MSGQATAGGKIKSNWLIWWLVNQDEVNGQVASYGKIPFFRSARGASVVCILITSAISLTMVALGLSPVIGLLDVITLGALGVFIAQGQRWAMVAAMIVWTLEKGAGLLTANPAVMVSQVIWWCIFMHAFYLALRVEQARRQA